MEEELHEAVIEDSVTYLLNLLGQDSLILDRYIAACSTETQLHMSVMLGHLEFATELLKWKPELACKLDSRKSTPLHLASAKGDVEMVKLLLSVNPQMCHTCDGRGWNPLHVAAMKGRVDALRELVRVGSEAACFPIDDGGGLETILHLCVKYNQLETLKFLLVETLICDDAEFLNSKDGDGNTILHVAVIDRQFQTIEFLMKNTSIDVNAKNVFGLTALDLLEIRLKDASADYPNIGLLQHAGAMNSRSNVSSETTGAAANMMSTVAGGSILEEILDRLISKQEAWHERQERNGRLESQRNTVMITASLIAAAAFQAGANPPGGFWQDTVHSNHTSTDRHTAGESILAYNFPGQYKIMVISNATAFFTSASVFLLLLSGLPLKNKLCTGILIVAMWLAIVAAGLSFIVSTEATGFDSATFYEISPWVVYSFFAAFGIIILCRIGRFLAKVVRRCWKKHRSSSFSSTAAPAKHGSV